MSYEQFFAQHVQQIKTRGQFQATAICPFHEDNRSSFSVNFATGQWMCFAGCGHGNHITFARRLQVSPPVSPPAAQAQRYDTDVQPISIGGGGHLSLPVAKEKKRVVEEYIYQDEWAQPLYKVLRFDPKAFAQMRWDAKEKKWVGGSMDGVVRVPYRLPKILEDKSRPVYWVEGEKDVHKLESIGLVATTSAMGAASWNPSYARWLEQRKVVVLPDNDAPGEAYATAVAGDLVRAGCRVKLVRLPGLADKQDVSDYLGIEGNNRDTLLDLVRNAPEHRAVHGLDESPLEYFARRNITIRSKPEIPTGWSSLCRQGYERVVANAKDLTASTFEKINDLEEAWRITKDADTYETFLDKLMSLDKSLGVSPEGAS